MLPDISLNRFGLRLHQLRAEDLESVRQGRNHPDVRKNHFHQDIISPEDHHKWFAGISDTRDYYFVVSRGSLTVGLIYLKDISPGLASGHLGMFFWEEKMLNTRTRVLAPLIFADFFFYSAGLAIMEAIVHPKNKMTLDMSRMFGFLPDPDSPLSSVRIVGTPARYLEQRPTCIRIAQHLNRDPATWDLRIEGRKDENHHPEVRRLIP